MNTMKWTDAWRPIPMLLVLLVVAALGAGGCSMLGGGDPAAPAEEVTEEVKPQDEPPEETEAQAEEKRKAEEARIAEEKRKAEEARIAEEKRKADEEQRQATAVREAFGPVTEKPAVLPPDDPPPGGTSGGSTGETMVAGAASGLIPFDEGVPPLPEEPVLRLAVLSEEDQSEKSAQVALTLGIYNRTRIEDRLGMAVKIAYVSLLEDTGTSISAIRFRPSFMKAALVVASELPHQQIIGPMTAEELRQDSVDLLVYIGPNYR